jgi:23S rRNA (guanosine2251-2'-O)-methyltransferase
LHLYGLHTVEAAFNNPQRERIKLLATENALRRLAERGVSPDVPVEIVSPRQLDKLVGRDAVHQGAVLEALPLPAYGARDLGRARLVLALDQVTDPHNVGAILRSAVALAADAVVTTERHAPEEGPVLAKSASGALDLIRHVRVKNMARFVAEMRETATAPRDSRTPNLATRSCWCLARRARACARVCAKPAARSPASTCPARSPRSMSPMPPFSLSM